MNKAVYNFYEIAKLCTEQWINPILSPFRVQREHGALNTVTRLASACGRKRKSAYPHKMARSTISTNLK